MKNSGPHICQDRREQASTSRRELSRRRTGGLEVALHWHEGAANVTVSVRDVTTGDDFELEVEPANALDAFRHPYAYAARRGIPFAQPDEDLLLADG